MCSINAFRIYNILLGFLNALISAGIVVIAIIWISSGNDIFTSEEKISVWLGIPRAAIDVTYMIFHVFYFFANICWIIGSCFEDTLVMIPIVIMSITSIVVTLLFSIHSSQDLIIAAGYSIFINFCIILTCCFHVKIRN
ncbi:hypothetical protein ACKWTF_000381 [Chironomus riparius]